VHLALERSLSLGIFVNVLSINKSNQRILLLKTHRNRKISLGCTVYCVIKFLGKNFWTISVALQKKKGGKGRKSGRAVTITQFLLVRGEGKY